MVKDDLELLAVRLAELGRAIKTAKDLNDEVLAEADRNIQKYTWMQNRLGVANGHLVAAHEEVQAATLIKS